MWYPPQTKHYLMPAQAKSRHVDIVLIKVIFCLLFLTLQWIENTDTLASKHHNNVSYSDMQICGRTGLHSTESGEGHTASKKRAMGSRCKFWARYFINGFLIKWNKSFHYFFKLWIMGKRKRKIIHWKKTLLLFLNTLQTHCEILHPFLAATLSYSVVIYKVDVSKCLPNGCQPKNNIVLKQLNFLKWTLFPKVFTDHTVSPRGLHAACGPYAVQACSRVLAIIIWLYFNFFSR